jgi:hypothetical protein
MRLLSGGLTVKLWQESPRKVKPAMGWTLNLPATLKWGLNVRGKKRTCLDCLHCKVSMKSTAKKRLYFCTETKKRKRHKEPYWAANKVCLEFEDMRA